MRDAAIQGPRTARRRPSGQAPLKTTRPGRAAKVAASAFDLFWRHPGKVLGALACIGMGGTIVGNAVLFQSGRHPAPLFAHPTVPPHAVPSPQDSSAKSAAVPMLPGRTAAAVPPVVRQIDLTPPARHADPDPAAPPAKAGAIPMPHVVTAKAPAARHADAIGKLIGGTDKTPVGTADPDGRVIAAQRSLAKLGFAVKPDGHLGASTRQALDKFAQDHHLAGGVDLTPKLLRDLAKAAAAQPSG